MHRFGDQKLNMYCSHYVTHSLICTTTPSWSLDGEGDHDIKYNISCNTVLTGLFPEMVQSKSSPPSSFRQLIALGCDSDEHAHHYFSHSLSISAFLSAHLHFIPALLIVMFFHHLLHTRPTPFKPLQKHHMLLYFVSLVSTLFTCCVS